MRRELTAGQSGIAATLLLVAVLSVLPVIDNQAGKDYESLFQRAFVTFALARTLNGVISAAQGTELALQPAGVGLTLTPGEVLDPVNDLVERFSWIMLGATVSLGIQHVLMDVSAWWLVKALLALISLWLLILVLHQRTGNTTCRVLIHVFIVALFLRFAVPLTLIANDALYGLFLEPRFVESTEVVRLAGKEIEQLQRQESPDQRRSDGVLGTVSAAVDRTRQALDLGQKLERIKTRAAETIDHLVQLSVVFVLQTAILPLVFLWLFLKISQLLLLNRVRAGY